MAFLRARWRDLLMVNWPIPREKLLPFVPAGCQLDSFEGKTYISLVAFLFEQTRVLGVSVPGYRHFEEVNLRFYVTHKTDSDEIRRGVVFLREYVPKKLIALVAKKVYEEPYEVLPMSHESLIHDSGKRSLRYTLGNHWLSGTIDQSPNVLEVGSLEHFIAEHYWGYTKTKNGTRQYRVSHPPWRWHGVSDYQNRVDFGSLYGSEWSFLGEEAPECIFLAEGSEISVDPWGKLEASSGREL